MPQVDVIHEIPQDQRQCPHDEQLLAYDIVQMDETTVQVLKEPGKTAQSKSYPWLQRGGPPDEPVTLFDYGLSRSQTVPKNLLEGFAGYLQTDGYRGYNGVIAAGGLVQLGRIKGCASKAHDWQANVWKSISPVCV